MSSSPVFRLLAHELRSPASVIAGYARMLREGRLDEAARQQALAQIERAASRITHLSRQASDLARWLAADHRPPGPGWPIRALMTRAIASSTAPDVPLDVRAEAESRAVLVLDQQSLADAVASVIDSVHREAMDDPIQVVVRAAGPPAGCDILVAPASRINSPDFLAARDEADVDHEPLALERGGQGLSLVVAAAVFSAHNSRIWAVGEPPMAIGISLLAAQG